MPSNKDWGAELFDSIFPKERTEITEEDGVTTFFCPPLTVGGVGGGVSSSNDPTDT